MRPRSHERHSLGGIGWLRASVLGANDGIVSTSSLILGVAAAHASQANILLSGTAALVAGAMSMATGEYVSVHCRPTPKPPLWRRNAPNWKSTSPVSGGN